MAIVINVERHSYSAMTNMITTADYISSKEEKRIVSKFYMLPLKLGGIELIHDQL